MDTARLRDALALLLITDDALLAGRDPVTLCQSAVDGGVTAVQLRLKRAPDRSLYDLSRRLIDALPVPVIVNDRADIAIAAGAAGVHLGPDDLAPALARAIAPPGFIIGASVGTDAEIARGASADYWGIGPLHGSLTKADAGAALGWDGVTRLVEHAGGRPCVVVGGVVPEDVPTARARGLAGVAVASGILSADDVTSAARRYRRLGVSC